MVKDGRVIATELVLCSSKYAYSFLGGTMDEYFALRPNDFLKNEIIKWCYETGREKLVLGGGYHMDDGIYRYKRSFSSAPDMPFYTGRHVFNPNAYERMISERKKEDASFDMNASFFPLYRS